MARIVEIKSHELNDDDYDEENIVNHGHGIHFSKFHTIKKSEIAKKNQFRVELKNY